MRAPIQRKGEAREVVITLRARAIIHAEGAIERPLIFGDNDRPGVMLASAVRTYLNRYALVGLHVLIATNNDSAWATAIDLAAAGAHVTLADERPRASTASLEKAGRSRHRRSSRNASGVGAWHTRRARRASCAAESADALGRLRTDRDVRRMVTDGTPDFAYGRSTRL